MVLLFQHKGICSTALFELTNTQNKYKSKKLKIQEGKQIQTTVNSFRTKRATPCSDVSQFVEFRKKTPAGLIWMEIIMFRNTSGTTKVQNCHEVEPPGKPASQFYTSSVLHEHILKDMFEWRPYSCELHPNWTVFLGKSWHEIIIFNTFFFKKLLKTETFRPNVSFFMQRSDFYSLGQTVRGAHSSGLGWHQQVRSLWGTLVDKTHTSSHFKCKKNLTIEGVRVPTWFCLAVCMNRAKEL